MRFQSAGFQSLITAQKKRMCQINKQTNRKGHWWGWFPGEQCGVKFCSGSFQRLGDRTGGREGGRKWRGRSEDLEGLDSSYIPAGDSRCPRNKTCSSALGTGVSLDLHFRAGDLQSLKWSLRDRAGPELLCVLGGGAGFQGGGLSATSSPRDSRSWGDEACLFRSGFPCDLPCQGADKLKPSACSFHSSPPTPIWSPPTFYKFPLSALGLRSLLQSYSPEGCLCLHSYGV